MIYYLYVKTHNKTGLKYLGYTNGNDSRYSGSGKYWKRHLQKYGWDISTNYIAAFDNKNDLAYAGKFWSQHWNTVKSNDWANLCEETGNGGNTSKGKKRPDLSERNRQRIWSKTSRNKVRLALLGKSLSEQTKEKIRKAHLGVNNHFFGKHHTEESKEKMRQRFKV